MKTLFPLILAASIIASARADDHKREQRHERCEQQHNFIIERQQAYQVQGVPTSRMIIGKREIDGYRDYRTGTTLWFEGDHVVGITR